MTIGEAKIVVDVLTFADGGCLYCVGLLFKRFNDKFPGFEDVLNEAWEKEDGSPGSWKEGINAGRAV